MPKRPVPDGGFCPNYDIDSKLARYDDDDISSFESFQMGEPTTGSDEEEDYEDLMPEPVPSYNQPQMVVKRAYKRPGPKPQVNPIFHQFWKHHQQGIPATNYYMNQR